MTREDVIRMAREAGFERVIEINPNTGIKTVEAYADDSLERFAKLVAAAEREACAKVAAAERMEGAAPVGSLPPQIIEAVEITCRQTGRSIAEKIRARGNA